MNMTFQDVTTDNWIECICLTTKKGTHELFEEFVASNAVSLAQSKIQDGWITKAIYVGDTMVGFTMFGYAHENGFHEICRIMIDYKFQGNGYGKRALLMAIDEMKKDTTCKELFLSFEPNNDVAKKLYESAGFEDTGKIIDNELLYRLHFPVK